MERHIQLWAADLHGQRDMEKPDLLLASKTIREMTLLIASLKGTVQRDFSPPVFFAKWLVLVSIDMPKSDFQFCQIFVELFVLKISKYRLPAVTDSGESKIQP